MLRSRLKRNTSERDYGGAAAVAVARCAINRTLCGYRLLLFFTLFSISIIFRRCDEDRY